MDPAPTAPAPPPPATAVPPGVLAFLLALAPLFLVGVLAQSAHPVLGLAWTEVFVLFLPALIAAEAAGLRTWRLLRVRWPGAKRVALGFGAGLAGYLLASGLMLGAIAVLPRSWVEANDVGRLFELPGWQPVGIAFVASLLAPVCEEVTFRGYVLSALSGRRPAVAIGGSALLFAAIHVDPVR
ncbi:MAG TPA: type II CAAX endopeptidase family protein, partial [Anaeromyxobacteraceae bacterium]|nr:type II CAAX endopeptidase family protein [Anaeromyxobacteraceae bacterium]